MSTHLKCREPCLWNEDGDDPIQHGVQGPWKWGCRSRRWPELPPPSTQSHQPNQEKWRHMVGSAGAVLLLMLSSGIHSAPMTLHAAMSFFNLIHIYTHIQHENWIWRYHVGYNMKLYTPLDLSTKRAPASWDWPFWWWWWTRSSSSFAAACAGGVVGGCRVPISLSSLFEDGWEWAMNLNRYVIYQVQMVNGCWYSSRIYGLSWFSFTREIT